MPTKTFIQVFRILHNSNRLSFMHCSPKSCQLAWSLSLLLFSANTDNSGHVIQSNFFCPKNSQANAEKERKFSEEKEI